MTILMSGSSILSLFAREKGNMKTLLVIHILILTISATAGSLIMILDPSGNLPGLQGEWLSGTPFNDFLIPGILLLLTVALPGIISWISLITRGPRALRYCFSFSLISFLWVLLQLILVPGYSGISVFYLALSLLSLLISMQLMRKIAL